MAKDITLKSPNGEEIYYPKTVSDLVYDNESGKTVKDRIIEFWRYGASPISFETLEKRYYHYADNKIASTGKDIKLYKYKVKQGDKVAAYVYGDSNLFSAIVFHKTDGTLLTDKRGNNGGNLYETIIPADVDEVWISNQDEISKHNISITGYEYASSIDFNEVKKQAHISNLFWKYVDGLDVDEIVDNKYIKYETGKIITAAVTKTRISIIKNNGYKIVRANLKTNDVSATIAFYAGDYTDISNYLKDYSVQGTDGNYRIWYEAIVPPTAKYIIIASTYEHDKNEIELYQSVEDKLNNLVKENTLATTETTGINEVIDIYKYDVGTKFKLDIIESNGDVDFAYYYDGKYYSKTKLNGADTIYFERYSDLFTKIRFFHDKRTDGTISSINYKLTVTDKPVSFKLDFNSYSPVSNYSLDNVKWFSGYWQNNKYKTVYYATEWMCIPIQFTNGCKLTLNGDFDTYYYNFAYWNRDLKSYKEFRITKDKNTIDLTSMFAWHINIRRLDRANIKGKFDEVLNSFTVSFTDTVYEKAVTFSELETEKDNYKETVKELIKEAETNNSNYIYNPFAFAPHYYHYKPNKFILDTEGNKIIPSQSIADVEIASRLGFKFIEANIHKTSDGRFICIHGSSGTLGTEVNSEYANTNIADVTLDFIKQNVKYDSSEDKYKTSIPSLEEFCEACKVNNIGIFAGTSEKEAIDICVKYLGESNVIIYNPPANIRDYFNGYVFQWRNGETPVETIMASANSFGAPYMLGIGPVMLDYYNETDTLNTLISEMHKKNYLVGVTGVYDSETDVRNAMKLGCDFNCSGHEVNPFESNYELFDIELGVEDFTTTGNFENGTLTLIDNQTLSCGSTSKISLGKGQLDIRFNGRLVINFGSVRNRDITSDGSELITISDYFFRNNINISIVSVGETKITHLVYKTSKC